MIYDDDNPKGGSESRSRLPDSIRKAVVGGLSAVLMTEEGIRNAVSDMRLPKDAIAFLAQQTERTRRELYRMVSDEVKGFLGNLDIGGAMRKALSGMRVEVKAELRFVDEDTGVSLKTKTMRGSVPVVDDDDDEDGEDAPRPRKARRRR
ncbi:MAG: hypothetical protein ACAI38_15550 [Myxococcota bacterium]|nr:hypothetical protein [Myxococcota bacterium]